MVIMALDHTREYLHVDAAAFDPTDPQNTNLILYVTRWITYLCAPTFVFLSGLSVWLRRQRYGSTATARFAATRGAWLILMELTLVGLGFTFHPGYLFLQVIWVIGASMMLLALLHRLPTWAVLIIGCTVIAFHDALYPLRDSDLGSWSTAFAFFDGRFAFVGFGPFKGVLLYSLLGWAGIALVGYGLGPIFRDPVRRVRALLAIGTSSLALFLLLRIINVYGDPAPWTAGETSLRTAMAFMRVSKYPPSLDFTLVTLGLMMLLFICCDRWRNSATQLLRTYGRTPFFYYLLHIYLIHGTATIIGLAQGRPLSQFTDPLNPPANFGFPLPVVYIFWLSFVIALYPACRWFERVRQRRNDWWLSYL